MIASAPTERPFDTLSPDSSAISTLYSGCKPHRPLSSSFLSSLSFTSSHKAQAQAQTTQCNNNSSSTQRSTAPCTTQSLTMRRDRSCPTMPITAAVSPMLALKRRLTGNTKRSQKFARMANRRIINASHHPRLKHQQPLSTSSMPSSPFPSTPHPLSPFEPAPIGAVTEAVLQDQPPMATRACDSLGCTNSRACTCHQAGLSPSNPRGTIPDSCLSLLSPSNPPKTANAPHTSSCQCPCFNTASAQGCCLCSDSSTMELQATVYMHPSTTIDCSRTQQQEPFNPLDLSPSRPSKPAKRSSVTSTHRPRTSWRLVLTSDNPEEASPVKQASRRYSDGEAVWTRVFHSKEKVIARLRSGSAVDLDHLPRRGSSSAWPPVAAMVSQGLAATKRSANLNVHCSTPGHLDGFHGFRQEGSLNTDIDHGYDQSLPFPQSNKHLPAVNSSLNISSSYTQPLSTSEAPTGASPKQRFSLLSFPTTTTLPSLEQRSYYSREQCNTFDTLPYMNSSAATDIQSGSKGASNMNVCNLFQTLTSRHMVSRVQQRLRFRIRSRRRTAGRRKQVALRITQDPVMNLSPVVQKDKCSIDTFKFSSAEIDTSQSPRPVNESLWTANHPSEQKHIQGHDQSDDCQNGSISVKALSGCGQEDCEKESISSSASTLSAEHHISLDVCNDHHQPMTDGSDKKDVMTLLLDDSSSSALLLPGDRHTEELVSANTITSSSAVAPSLEQVDSYRFPTRVSPFESNASIGPRRFQHSYHQSLPYNTLQQLRHHGRAMDPHSSTPSDTADIAVSSSDRAGSSGQSQLGKPCEESDRLELIEQGVETHTLAMSNQRTVETQMGFPRRLRRSGSCGSNSHRPSLSFSSSKRALLSLQERRMNKPDAKIHRLPDILTTATASVPDGSDSTSSKSSDLVDHALNSSKLRDMTSEDLRQNHPAFTAPRRPPRRDSDGYHMQVSDKDREAVESILTEGMEYELDAMQPHVRDHERSSTYRRSLSSTAAFHESSTLQAGTIDLPLSMEPVATPSPTLEENATMPDPVDDAGATRRFVKRSHALQELLATEESYVDDLDVLMHVRIITTSVKYLILRR